MGDFMIIDTHCHLSSKDYENIDEVIRHMEDNIMIASGADILSNQENISLIKNYNNIYATIGLHPEEAKNYTKEDLLWLENHINYNKIVGIGEIGLDYHYEGYDKVLQKKMFIEQIKLAKKHHKVVVIHSRDAMADTLEIIKTYLSGYPTVMHCYSGSVEVARILTDMGIMLGIGGVLTFKNASKLVEVVREIDLKYLLLETDSPYLTPEPYRGKINEPYNVLYVARKIAEIKNISLEEVLEITTNNAIRLFDLDI